MVVLLYWRDESAGHFKWTIHSLRQTVPGCSQGRCSEWYVNVLIVLLLVSLLYGYGYVGDPVVLKLCVAGNPRQFFQFQG